MVQQLSLFPVSLIVCLSHRHCLLHFHTLDLYFSLVSESIPSLSLALSRSPSLSLALLFLSSSCVTLHLSLSDVVSLVSSCCVYLMVDLSQCDGSFLSSVYERLCMSVYFVSCLPPGREMSRLFFVLLLCLILCHSCMETLFFDNVTSEG